MGRLDYVREPSEGCHHRAKHSQRGASQRAVVPARHEVNYRD